MGAILLLPSWDNCWYNSVDGNQRSICIGDIHVKLVTLSSAQANALVEELRAMADLPPGTNPAALQRAREIRFLLQGQAFTTPTSITKADAAFRDLEVLLHAQRWQGEISLEHLRKRIKSSCERLRVHLGLGSRKST